MALFGFLQGISKQALQEDDVQRIISVSILKCMDLHAHNHYLLVLKSICWPRPTNCMGCRSLQTLEYDYKIDAIEDEDGVTIYRLV